MRASSGKRSASAASPKGRPAGSDRAAPARGPDRRCARPASPAPDGRAHRSDRNRAPRAPWPGRSRCPARRPARAPVARAAARSRRRGSGALRSPWPGRPARDRPAAATRSGWSATSNSAMARITGETAGRPLHRLRRGDAGIDLAARDQQQRPVLRCETGRQRSGRHLVEQGHAVLSARLGQPALQGRRDDAQDAAVQPGQRLGEGGRIIRPRRVGERNSAASGGASLPRMAIVRRTSAASPPATAAR